MHRAFYKFVLRMAFGSLGASLAGVMFCAGLAACAEDPNYPSLGKISGLENILTPEERQKAVQDLQRQEQVRAQGTAVQTASK